jgi:hypothetical protein
MPCSERKPMLAILAEAETSANPQYMNQQKPHHRTEGASLKVPA